MKLYQKFTHPDMYLSRAGATDWAVTPGDLDEFRLGVDPIANAGRLAAILMQFPASFRATPEARDYIDWLSTGLGAYPLAVELRHRSWSDESATTDALLSSHQAAWVHIDEPKFPGSIEQDLAAPPEERQPTAPLMYVRLHGRNAARWWSHEEADDRYDYLYTPAELQPFANAARRASAAGRRVVMYLNNHFSAKAVANAAVLQHQIGGPVPGNIPAR